MDTASAATAGCVLVAGERRWRVAASDVLDVIPWPTVTGVPLQPKEGTPKLLGIFEWNTALVPVFDVSCLQPGERRCVVIVRATVSGTHAPIGLAAADVAAADEYATADLLDIPQLTAHLPKAQR